MGKLKSSRGETFVESLVSLLIVTMTFAFLASAAVTASRLNGQVRDTDVSFRYDAENTTTKTATVTVTNRVEGVPSLTGVKIETGTVSLHEYNGYLYYDSEDGGAGT